MPTQVFAVRGANGKPDRVVFQQVGLSEFSFSRKRRKCPVCKRRIRGKNHDEGSHHNAAKSAQGW